MWNPFRARREHQIRLAEIEVEKAKVNAEAMRDIGLANATAMNKLGEIVKEISLSSQKSAEVLQTWLEGFKVAELPMSSTVREEDEVLAAVERKFGTHEEMPEGLPPEFQLAWLMKQGALDE